MNICPDIWPHYQLTSHSNKAAKDHYPIIEHRVAEHYMYQQSQVLEILQAVSLGNVVSAVISLGELLRANVHFSTCRPIKKISKNTVLWYQQAEL